MVKQKRKKLFLFGGLAVLGLVVLPVTIFLFQQQQETRSRAEKTVILSFEPSSTQTTPMQIPAGTTFTLDVFLDPGSNSVSYIKSEIQYDANLFELAGGFIPNRQVFSQIVENPLSTPGKLITTQSIGSDYKKAIKQKTKIGTLALKVKNNAPANATAQVTFGNGSQALAISGNSSFDENVIASTQPAVVQINKRQLTCGISPADVMLVMDRSGSMMDSAGASGSKLNAAKAAGNNFIDIVAAGTNNQSGLATFANTSSLNSPLTTNLASVKTAINGITASGNTCIQCGILAANQEITAHKRTGIKNTVILLTDGEANFIQGSSSQVSKATAEQKALEAALAGYNANDTVFYTIGLGREVNSDFLQQLAESTGGQYYYSPTTNELNSIYTQISEILARGSVSGVVYNDKNGNGQKDQDDEPLPGWLLQFYPTGSTAPQAITTDSTGTYSITNICDGSYTMKQVMRDGWKQTDPANSANLTFSITNGNAITDKNFGNHASARCSDLIDNDGNGYIDDKDATCHTDGNPDNPTSYEPTKDGERAVNTCSDSIDNNKNGRTDGADPNCHTDGNPENPDSYDPKLPEESPTGTPVPAPQSSDLSVTIALHGIGNSGDNANPTASSLSNKTPVHKERLAKIEILDSSNQLITSGSGTITYASSSGDYKGTIRTNGPLPTGIYTMKLSTDYHLTRLAPGIQNVTTNIYNVPAVALVAGDANKDNRLDILDYNTLLDCYSDLSTAPNCNDAKKLSTDANDDGSVNQFDYNLFLREISTQPGE